MNVEHQSAVQYADSTECTACGRRWDTNDPEPPDCDPLPPDLNRRHGCLICIATALGTIALYGVVGALLVLFW